MSADDENRFRPKPGRVRSDGGKAGQTKSFLSKVRKVTRQQQAASGRSRLAKGGDPGYAAKGTHVIASGRGVQRGRGASFVRTRNLSNGWSHRQPGSRRVIVKSRSVRGAGMRIPVQAGRVFRHEAGQRSDLMPATIPE